MNIITEPSVYVVGRQTVDDAELNRFLADHGVAWESDSEIAGEVLTETAGRVCYMSFAKPRPGGNSAYLNHIKEVGHGCYDAETEVLTANGWKSWPDVTMDDQLATIDPETNRIEYHHPIRLINFHHTGTMYRVESQGVDLLVTPGHKMLAAKTTTKEGRANPKFYLFSAEELGTTSHRYLKCGEWHNPKPEYSVDRDVLALLGFAIGDGHIHGPGSTTVRFHLRRERKISWLRALCGRLRDRGFRLYENPEMDRYAVLLPDEGTTLDLFARIYDEDREKKIPQQVLLNASRESLEGLYEGLMQSDGHEGQTGDSFDTTSPHLPGQFQQLCLHLGFAANICYTYGPDQRPNSYGDKPLTRLNVIRRSLRPEVNKWSGAVGRSFWIDGWEGEVYCAEVPNNTLYVRRNGIPVWSGNSVLEHAVWNLLITGVSRSLTHELIRHRAGMSYSMLSQRYVDESIAEYVVPPDLREEIAAAVQFICHCQHSPIWKHGATDKFETQIEWALDVAGSQPAKEFKSDEEEALTLAGLLWLRSMVRASEDYRHQSAYLTKKAQASGMSGTDARKFARQAARSVLPNATETKIFVTGNARALRHFLEMRGSRHADTEIRRLAGAVLDVLVKESPNLFGDYQKTLLPDGTYEITTKFAKV